MARQDNNKDNKQQIALDAIGGIGGAKMLHSSKDRLLGQKTLYHGTSNKNWENIKKEGLKASRGGIGGACDAFNAEGDRISSKNYVHVTGIKSKADMYSRMPMITKSVNEKNNNNEEYRKIIKEKADIESKYLKYDKNGNKYLDFPDDATLHRYHQLCGKIDKINEKSIIKSMNPFAKKEKRIKIKMDYDKYKNNFHIDPDEQGGVFMGKGKFAEGIGKHFASKGKVDIGKDEIVGLHKTSDRLKGQIKRLPSYIKNNPGRFGAGVALASGGSYLTARSIRNLKEQIRRRAEDKRNKQ